MFPATARALTDELFILTQPAHLQRLHTGKLSADERDLVRADMIRERLKTMERPTPPPPPPAPSPAAD
jgi:protein arginine kinase